MCRSPVKWAGGKTRLLPLLLPLVPERVRTYCEPFAGGAALFFALASEKPRRFEHAVLCDANAELVLCYRELRRSVRDVIDALKGYKPTKRAFYEARAMRLTSLSPPEAAARFIFLNKTCFNGLYRVNRRGEFNVPFGRYKRPRICDEETLHAASAALQLADIELGDFKAVTQRLGPRDFVYFDPPYAPASKTADFTSYTAAKFGASDQARLAHEALRLHRKGVRVLVSNADVSPMRKLYAPLKRRLVHAPRAINSVGSKRGPVRELLLVG
jgi:DNA adenine methylase